MYTIDTCPNLTCRDCKFFRVRADLDGVESLCKRIDHKDVKFAVPWFKSYDCGMNHMICADFIPAHPEYADFKEWTCFEDYWEVYVKAWLPYEDTGTYLSFTHGSNTSVRYEVPLMLFINGEMIQDGILKATKKKYYARCSRSKNPLGLNLMTEQTDGVDIRTEICFGKG